MAFKITDQELSQAIEELVASLGVKEEVPLYSFSSLLQAGRIEECITAIARQLNLPIRPVVSYVKEGNPKASGPAFESRALGRRTQPGEATEGIVAQVGVPSNLPLYGSGDLTGFPVQVRVSDNCARAPETFVTIIAHELAHVLLHALRHPRRNYEFYTDLVPMLFGFRTIMLLGRKRTDLIQGGTRVTTYGYLSDDQFDKACVAVGRIWSSYEKLRSVVSRILPKLDKASQEAEQLLGEFAVLLPLIDAEPCRRIPATAANTIVRCHDAQHNDKLVSAVRRASVLTKEATMILEGESHCSQGMESLRQLNADMNSTLDALRELGRSLRRDNRTMRKYLRLRVRLTLWVSRMRRKGKARRADSE